EFVEVSLDNGSTWTTATSSVGSNTYSLSGVTLTASNTLKVRVTDTAGNSGTMGSQSYILDTTAPTSTGSTVAFSADTGVSSTDFLTRTAAQTLSGTLSANLVSGELVEVSLDNGSTWTTATSSVGSNTFSLSGVTLSGSDTLRVRVTDTAGNSGTTLSQAYVLDTTAPTTTVATLAFSNDSGASSSDFITNLTTQSISGTLSANVIANERIEVSLDNGSTWVTATSTVGANTFSLTGQTLSSSNTLKVRMADAAGNTGTQASQAYVLDLVAPGAPTSFNALGSGASASLTWNNPATDFASVTLRRSLSGFPNSTVAGAAVLANSTGTSHLDTGLSDGVNYYSLFALDAAGNVSAAATTSVSIDGTAPNPPAIVAISNDTGSSATDHLTTDPTLVFTGTADANTTVALYRNASPIGTTAANGAGGWSFDYTGTTLAAGTHTFTATSADTSGNISTPSAAFLVEIDSVTPNAPAITAINSDNGPLNSDGITNDRTLVFSGTGEIGASITLVRTGVGVIGTSTVNGAGAWSVDYSGTTLPDGSYLFTAFATDAAGNSGSVSSDFPVTIDTSIPTITSQPSGGTFPPDSVLTLSVTATDGHELSYQWYRDDAQLGDNNERSGSTEATFSHSSIAVETVAGDYRVVVTDRAGNSVTSEVVTVVVGKVDQSITFPAIDDKLTTSTPFEVIASVESKLPITFSVVSGPATVNGRIVTVTGAGSVVIRATQAGNSSYNPATADRTFVVSKAIATLTLSGLTATFDGSPKSVSVTTVPAGLAVQVTYAGGATLPTAPGSYPVVATLSDASYQGSTSGTLVIANASQTISFPTPSNRTYGDAAFALVASASSGLPVSFVVVSGPASIAGNVLTLNGAGTITVRAMQEGSGTIEPAQPIERSLVVSKKSATVALSGLNTIYDGAARSVSVTTSPVGLATATTYNGNTTPPVQAGTYAVLGTIIDPNHAGSSSGTLTIAKAAQSLVFDAVGSVQVGASVALQATASSGLPVSFAVVSGEGTIAGHTLTLTRGGPVVVRASQAGNGNYEAATPVDRNVDANKLTQTITFAAPGDKTTSDANFGLVATASSGLPVSFAVLSGPAFVAGGTVSLTGLPGSVLVQAFQSGNAIYEAAQPVVRSFSVASAGPQVYFGSTTSGDHLAASFLPGSDIGTLLVYLSATREGFVVALRIDPSGHFSGTATRNPSLQSGASVPDPIGTRTAMKDLAPVAAPTPLTFQGTITQGTLSGSLVELGLNFSASIQPGAGITPDLSGTYSAMSTTTASGSVHAIVSNQGRVFALAFTSEGTYSGESTLVSGGAFQINAGQSTLRGSIQAVDTSIAVTVTHTDGIKEVFAGLASTTAPTDRLINLSSRALVSSADSRTLITGFVIGGSSPKSLLLRAIGPGLSTFGVTQALVDPKLQVFNSAGQLLLENDNWSGTSVSEASARVGAFALAAQSKDASAIATLPPGAYTMLVLDQGGAGVALAEIYELNETSGRQQRLINLSSRGHVAPGEGVLVGGFVVTGNTPKRLLIRASGPGLAGFGVNGALADPFLRLFDHTSALIARNDNWELPLTAQTGQIAATAVDLAATAQEAGAFAFTSGSKDAAVLITLAPGLYSAQVSSSTSASGVALIEVYEVIE
ncbi:MAG: hypothetical protein JNN01_19070, partial [Opitutaceae bacterium]|nr:hypothetical protein [Opitutaceae bacterium]